MAPRAALTEALPNGGFTLGFGSEAPKNALSGALLPWCSQKNVQPEKTRGSVRLRRLYATFCQSYPQAGTRPTAAAGGQGEASRWELTAAEGGRAAVAARGGGRAGARGAA